MFKQDKAQSQKPVIFWETGYHGKVLYGEVAFTLQIWVTMYFIVCNVYSGIT